MTTAPELVVLVDENGVPTGSVEKFAVHTTDTPLHLAFSCHVYNPEGQVLVTRRALGKLTWPGVWTNSFCGHPAPGESMEDAVARRAQLELGIRLDRLEPLLPDFRYRAVDASGIVENEICPVFRAVTTDAVAANPDEVAEWAWSDPAAFGSAVAAAPYAFSPWVVLQLAQLDLEGSGAV
jgi:isopentenyl-diphosphate delta-isomerase